MNLVTVSKTLRQMLLFSLAAPATVALWASHGLANTFEKDLATLIGEWQGQGVDGTRVKMTFTTGHGNLMVSGNWKIEGGSFAGDSDVTLLHMGGLYFLMPEATPFTPGKEPYSLLRLPGGGLRFVRLSHVEVGNLQGLQAEEVLIGKRRGDGTRTLKLISSDKICADATAPAGKVCGDALSEQIVMHKMNP